ncbi:hypothetical protein HN371_01080 [Candidatus Poribacteria bacterium]|nr:hypothetical protein [Candidatus Poribacteria bacterium]
MTITNATAHNAGMRRITGKLEPADGLEWLRDLVAEEMSECVDVDDLEIHYCDGDVTYDGPCGVQIARGLYPSIDVYGSGRLTLEWQEHDEPALADFEGVKVDDVRIDVEDYDGSVGEDLGIFAVIEGVRVTHLDSGPARWNVEAVVAWEGC